VDSSTNAYTINNLLNQYDATTSSAAAFDYDDDGNLTDDGRYTYTWDAENRLIALERKQPRADGDKRLTFQYDYLGRRVRKQVFAWATDHWQLATDESFIYNGWEVIEVVDALAGATGELLTQYTWGLDLSGGLQGAGGIGGLLACEWPQTTGESKKYWFFYDANGNVGQLVKGADAALPVAARYEYDAYGNPAAAPTGTYADANPFRFSTKWRDDETGLYYYGYRYYSPGVGRWISRDPIAEDGGFNVYAANGNNLIDNVDSRGLFWKAAACCLCVGSVLADLGGGAAGCVSGCLQYSNENISTSECVFQCCMTYLADRMDHSRAYNAYKSIVEGESFFRTEAACCRHGEAGRGIASIPSCLQKRKLPMAACVSVAWAYSPFRLNQSYAAMLMVISSPRPGD